MSEVAWDQSVFDSTLKEYLSAHESEVWPRCVNEKAYNIAYKAMEETPVKETEMIETELRRTILVDKPGSHGSVEIGLAIAAKRASKQWSYAKSTAYPKTAIKTRFGKGGSLADAWRRAITKHFKSMLGARKRTTGFLALGWISVLQELSSKTRQGVKFLSTHGGNARIHGRPMGQALAATPDNLNAIIQNFAHARSEMRGAFHRIGDAALERAFQRETANMREYLEGQMKPEAEKFNSKQH